MTIAFAACIGDRQDVALVLMTPATICVCRADQRAHAAELLGYSEQVFDRVNERSGKQKYKTVNRPSRSRGNGCHRRGAASLAAAAAPPAAGAATAGLQALHMVNTAVQAPAVVAAHGTPQYAPAGTGVWQPDLPQSAPVQHEGEAHAAGSGGSLGADSPAKDSDPFNPVLAEMVEYVNEHLLWHATGDVSAFQRAREPCISECMPHEGPAGRFGAHQMDSDSPLTSNANPMRVDDEVIGESHGGHAASAQALPAHSFLAAPPHVVSPHFALVATQMPAPSAVNLASGAKIPCTAADAAGGAAAGQAFGQQGFAHYLQPGCRPVATAATAVERRGRGLHGEVLDLQGLLEPRLPPMGAACMWPDQREAPVHMAEGFDYVQLASGGLAAGPPPGDDVAQGAQGTWLDLPAPMDDGGDAGAAPVGFGDVQAPGLFAGMQPTQGAYNLQDLLQLRSRDAAAASAHPPEPAAIPPQGEAAVEAAAVSMLPDDEQFAQQLAQIEDLFDRCNDVLGDGFMDVMGSDLDFDHESGAFPVDLHPMP